MDIAVHLVVFVAGLAALVVGGDGLVRGAASIARTFGISPLVVGLTVVAFGTSAPELAVSLTSGLSDSADLALGNVVGSNIFNILLILGIAAILNPLKVQRQLVRFDIPVMIASALLLTVLSLDGTVSRAEGAVLAVLLVGYVATTIISATRSPHLQADDDAEEAEEGALERMDWVLSGVAVVLISLALSAQRLDLGFGLALVGTIVAYLAVATAATTRENHLVLNLFMLVFSIAAVALSAQCMVDGAVGIAHIFEIPEAVIGLTIVAAGTSLPELVTTVAAGRAGQSDIAIGNVVGSNIFNVLCIVGVTGSVVALPVDPALLRFDYAVMVGSMVGLWPLLWLRKRVGLPDGIMMLTLFVGYLGIQLMRVL